MDFYNTYSRDLVEHLKTANPNVVFKRKHADRFGDSYKLSTGNKPYLRNVPEYLQYLGDLKVPVNKQDVKIRPQRDTIRNSATLVGEIPINKDKYLQINRYHYLIMYRPTESITSNLAQQPSPFYYLPLFGNEPNPILQHIPQSVIAGKITTAIPPQAFAWGCYLKETGYTFKNQGPDLIVLTPNYYFGSSVDIFYDLIPTMEKVPTYNLDYYYNEPMLYMEPFYTPYFNDTPYPLNLYSEAYPGSPSYQPVFLMFTDKIYMTFPQDDATSSTAYSTYKANREKMVFDISEQHLFATSALTEYVNNNLNSIQTGLSLAQERKGLLDEATNGRFGANLGTSIANIIGGIGMGALGFLTGGIEGVTAGIGSVIGGAGALASSTVNRENELALNAYNYKSTVKNTEAAIADVARRPNTVVNAGSLGITKYQNTYPLSLYIDSIPQQAQLMVFSDIYFNGYIFNSVAKFNEYNNRMSFNYFELSNVFALANQYLKYPKKILKDITTQLEGGVRLWKTPNFDYTMTLNNMEQKYVTK